MIRFTIVFLALFLGLFVLCLLPPVERAFVEPFTAGVARVCTALVSWLDPSVIAQGKFILNANDGTGIRIERGCNGLEAMIILVSAVLAFPSPWKHKLVGLAIGFVAIQGLNVVRIISLFYLGQWSLTAFEWFHLYIWQALIILDAMVVWLVWLRYLPKPTAPSGRRLPA